MQLSLSVDVVVVAVVVDMYCVAKLVVLYTAQDDVDKSSLITELFLVVVKSKVCLKVDS